MKTLLRSVWVLLLFISAYHADVTIDGTIQHLPITELEYYEDKEAGLDLKQIQSQTFTPLKSKVASFGFTDAAYWYRFSFSSTEQAKAFHWWLNVAYPLLDELDLYICDKQGQLLSHRSSGRLHPFENREVADVNFLFKLDLQTTQQLYLRVHTQSTMQVPLRIQTTEDILEKQQFTLLISGIYYGFFLLIFFYNLVSFIYTRDRSYFLYLLFICSFVMFQLALDGLGIRFIWGEWKWMVLYSNATVMTIMTFSILLFTREFLKTNIYLPRVDKLLKYLAMIMFAMMILATFRPYSEIVIWIALAGIVLPPILLAIGIYTYKQGFDPARFYVIGWGSFLIGSALFAMNKLAWIGGYDFFANAQQVGSALQMLFLSWALADYQRQSEKEYVQKLNGLNRILKEKVDTSLSQVRQNDQVLIEKSRLAAMGEMIEQIAHQWRQPLNSLSLINQNLYFKVQLGTAQKDDYVDAHNKTNEQLQYMSQTIDDFRNFSQPNKDKEVFMLEEVIKSALNLSEGSLKYAKVKPHVFSDEEHPVYGMRHEMMQVCMNMIKNVQDVVLQRKVDDPWLKIYISNRDEEVVLAFEDNGGGVGEKVIQKIFDPYFSTKSHQGTGIGLYMSKEIIEKSMLGKIGVTNTKHGARFEIILPQINNT